jgi:hypothetical protein
MVLRFLPGREPEMAGCRFPRGREDLFDSGGTFWVKN